jgi:glucan 1,3-beta-glucosidase
MNPSLYTGTGLGWDGSLCKLVNYSKSLAEERMQTHLSTWITESDIQAIKSYGFNSLRVPIGYWNILSDPYHRYAPQNPEVSHRYLNWLFQITQQYELSILIDLHGAPGSQNGMDHSGCSREGGGDWISDSIERERKNLELTYETLELIMQHYGTQPNLIGIELLNEPSLQYEQKYHQKLFSFYQNSYSLIRQYHPSLLILFNELYSDYYSIWRGDEDEDHHPFYQEPHYVNVIMDWHLYHWQDYYVLENTEEVLSDVMSWRDLIQNYSQWNDHPIVIGEWSMSCGNGEKGKELSQELGQRFVNEMVESFAQSWAIGWYVWNWKIDQSTTVKRNIETGIATGAAAGGGAATGGGGAAGGGGGGDEGETRGVSGEYDPWDVQYQSTLPDGLRVPFVPPGGGELFINHPSPFPARALAGGAAARGKR